jgi:hypothetical protein
MATHVPPNVAAIHTTTCQPSICPPLFSTAKRNKFRTTQPVSIPTPRGHNRLAILDFRFLFLVYVYDYV